MMACEEFEDRLIDRAELSTAEREAVDAHLAGCAGCRDYLETLTALDTKLALHYSGVESPLAFEQQVLSRRDRQAKSPRLTIVPELLDFAGWTAVIASVASLALLLPVPALQLPPPEVLSYAVSGAAALAVAGAAWAGIRSYAEMSH